MRLKPIRYGAQETPELAAPPVHPIWWYAEALKPTSHGVTNTFIWTRFGIDARHLAERVLRLEACDIRLTKCEDYPEIFAKKRKQNGKSNGH
jgi:hypothetical protein